MGKFITDQILGMKWLNTLIGNLLNALGLDTTSRIGGSAQFFLYDVIKITVLLCVLSPQNFLQTKNVPEPFLTEKGSGTYCLVEN